jgi:hypothetical protein
MNGWACLPIHPSNNLMIRKHTLLSLALGLTLSIALPIVIAAAEEPDPESESSEEKDGDTDVKKKVPEKESKIKPYDEVITKDAKTDAGLFYVHRVEEKVYYEIPQDGFDLPLLWVSQIAETQAGHGYGGNPLGNRVVLWELTEDDHVLLRQVRYTVRADVDDPIQHAVEASSLAPILARFPIKAWGKDKAPVIEVTDLFLGDLPEFSAKKSLDAEGADKGRSFIEQIKSFPDNIEARVLMTYKLPDDRGVVSALLHHSMVRLPENPMRPRLEDQRVGFFSVSFEDYASESHRVKEVRYITRWRLDKKDEEADISEPKMPIVFYVGRGVPGKWRPWVKKGIEAWQPAFEAAGFRNAILAREPPDPREDADWDAEDARYSVIRWLPSTIENAYGPHVHDPRTGEIIEADIRMYHNVLKLIRDWYFVQVSPLDERARKLPFQDELMGELLAFVVSHEVGHSLGLPHNMKASSAYTVAQVRDPEFTAQNGHVASIMDYGRFNYVAQPGDNVPLIPTIGPYDRFAIEWGYRQFADSDSPEGDLEHLEEIVASQVDNPILRFGPPNPLEDPTRQTEDLTSEPVEATRLGLLNINRIVDFILPATSQEGEDYSELENMYEQLLRQRGRELGHVASVVGGVEERRLWYGQADQVYHPLTADRQREAVAFLNEHAFSTPDALLTPDILLRLEAAGAADRLLNHQRGVLDSLLHKERLQRMAELAIRADDDAYPPHSLLREVRDGIWSELEQDPVSIGLYRRNLQRAHVGRLAGFVEVSPSSDETGALARAELDRLQELIREVVTHANDEPTRAHLRDIIERIEHTLRPK